MAGSTLETSTLTERYQTTVPSGVRKVLGLNKGDKLVYRSDDQGRIYLEHAQADHRDPALGPFLDLLAADMAANPARLAPLDPAVMARIAALVGDDDIDLDRPLSPDDA